jgi:ribosomal-protein-serine acetyltransferase
MREMENISELTNSVLTLRRYRREDAESIYRAVRESVAEISQWMPWCHEDYSMYNSVTWSDSRDDAWEKGAEYDFVIMRNVDGRPLGVCGLNHIDNENRFANVGYWIRTGETRQGAATSAVILLARFGFNELKLNRMEIVVACGNKPSQRVAEKAGATKEGILRKRLIVRGRVYDAVMYSLVAQDITDSDV